MRARFALVLPVLVISLSACMTAPGKVPTGVPEHAEPDESGFLKMMDIAGYAEPDVDADEQVEAGYTICEGSAESGETPSEYATRVSASLDEAAARDWYVSLGFAAEAMLCPW